MNETAGSSAGKPDLEAPSPGTGGAAPTTLGALVFRWRSYLPLLVVAGLFAGAYALGPAPTTILRASITGGLLLAALGLALRFYAVGQAPEGTSGRHRRQFASRLNTFGLYSIVRHPLYSGNILIWAGISLTSGWLPGAAASTVLGCLMFALIVRHEDEFLRRAFGAPFEEWAQVTPAFVPRPRLWRPARTPFRWAKAISSEYSTLHSIGLLALLFSALRGCREGEACLPGSRWWLLLALNSGLYLALRFWRASGRSRRRSDRRSNERPPAGGPPSAC